MRDETGQRKLEDGLVYVDILWNYLINESLDSKSLDFREYDGGGCVDEQPMQQQGLKELKSEAYYSLKSLYFFLGRSVFFVRNMDLLVLSRVSFILEV